MFAEVSKPGFSEPSVIESQPKAHPDNIQIRFIRCGKFAYVICIDKTDASYVYVKLYGRPFCVRCGGVESTFEQMDK